MSNATPAKAPRNLVLAAALALFAAAGSSGAAMPATNAGAYDPTFATGGKAMYNLVDNNRDEMYGIALQGDGKMLAVGIAKQGATTINRSVVLRVLDDGTPDPTFGVNGVAYPALPSPSSSTGIAVTPAGRILLGAVIGTPGLNILTCAIVALKDNGTIDTSFGTNGMTVLQPDAARSSTCGKLAIDAEGKIVVPLYQSLGGGALNSYVYRLDANGAIDPSFNGIGRISLASVANALPRFVTLESDGAIVISAVVNDTNAAVLFRFLHNGTPDVTFRGSGTWVIPATNGLTPIFSAVTALPESKLLVAGSAGTKPTVWRLMPDGYPDPSFGNGGVVEFLPSALSARMVSVQADGKLIAMGTTTIASGANRIYVARLNATGQLDPSFGTGGLASVSTSETTSDSGAEFALTADGRIWIGGITRKGTTEDYSFAMFRLLGIEITTPVVEFYNNMLQHYFITADPAEAAAIDAGAAGPGWNRTGQNFKSGGPNRVCRFYGAPEVNPATGKRRGPNSHFYTINSAECGAVKQDLGWRFESYDFNGWVPGAGGTCQAGTIAVKRVYNGKFAQNDSNHRYTTSEALYVAMLAQGWSGEGVVFCAPV